MDTQRNEPVLWRRRPYIRGLWLLLLLLGLGGSPSCGRGSACTGRRNAVVDTNDKSGRSELHADGKSTRHPAFGERVRERERMVALQIHAREIRDPNVLRALRTVPRHAFVPPEQRAHAHEDRPLYIGHGQTISQPYVVAFMTEALALDPNSVVLEIGAGSGYQAAVCAEIARAVYSIEIVEPLARSAAKVLAELGYDNVRVRQGDGYFGWPEKGPFDAIIGTAAAREVPPLLIEQLKPGGRMILPIEGEFGFQHLILLIKDEQGQLRRENVMPVRFVPMTGRNQQPARESDR